MSMDIINIAGFAIGIISLLCAIYENRKRKNLEDFNRLEAWSLYHQSCITLESVLFLEKELAKNKFIGSNIYKKLGIVETASNRTLSDAVRLIKRSEATFNENTINKWFQDKHILHKSHIALFKRLIQE